MAQSPEVLCNLFQVFFNGLGVEKSQIFHRGWLVQRELQMKSGLFEWFEAGNQVSIGDGRGELACSD